MCFSSSDSDSNSFIPIRSNQSGRSESNESTGQHIPSVPVPSALLYSSNVLDTEKRQLCSNQTNISALEGASKTHQYLLRFGVNLGFCYLNLRPQFPYQAVHRLILVWSSRERDEEETVVGSGVYVGDGLFLTTGSLFWRKKGWEFEDVEIYALNSYAPLPTNLPPNQRKGQTRLRLLGTTTPPLELHEKFHTIYTYSPPIPDVDLAVLRVVSGRTPYLSRPLLPCHPKEGRELDLITVNSREVYDEEIYPGCSEEEYMEVMERLCVERVSKAEGICKLGPMGHGIVYGMSATGAGRGGALLQKGRLVGIHVGRYHPESPDENEEQMNYGARLDSLLARKFLRTYLLPELKTVGLRDAWESFLFLYFK